MGHERWFRGQQDGHERLFDWRAQARQHGIPEQRARALYEQAVQQARGALPCLALGAAPYDLQHGLETVDLRGLAAAGRGASIRGRPARSR